MKILISYPPLAGLKGCPTIGQNRQFQYFKQPTYIYPVVPAQAASLLKRSGHEVIWNDCLAENIDWKGFLSLIRKHNPDVIAFETKTPVVKQHWCIINDLRQENVTAKIVLFGDHVTALPEESFQNSTVDFVLTGGDYDFLLKNLCDALLKPQFSANTLEPGVYYRENGSVKNTGPFKLDHDLNALPFIDRELTKWQLYAFENGNYKRTPGTYIMSGRDCWWGKCTFCSWPTLYPTFRVRSVNNTLDEIGELIHTYKVREIMDDTGCFTTGEWLRSFCRGMIERGYNKKIYLDCNMRFGALTAEDFKLMKKAGFRLLLFGLESANQVSLDRVNKNLKIERVAEDCIAATHNGLFPHITIMFGYPWEKYEDAQKTLQLGQWLLRKGYAYTMQATVVIPYPGTKLFRECNEQNLLRSRDWDDYDMKTPIMVSPISDDALSGLVQGMYKISYQPEFMLRKLLSVRDIDDLRYYIRAAKKVAGHVLDFRSAKKS
ncbi:MAG TPA: radical SAM protein [Candidatus Omnitrophota bacterium]|nr:radical SAM protein [Candidatus Omnitrophota bacterium]HPT07973.1 radical SAM protein [Candidatus Omnitrophota bacterium]